MTKSEKTIKAHIEKMNGLTNPVIAAAATGYAISTCKSVFKKIATPEKGADGQNFYFAA